MEIHILVFDAAPEPLDEHAVDPTALAVHADGHRVGLEHRRKRLGRELGALVRIEDLRRPVAGERVLEGLDTTSLSKVFDTRTRHVKRNVKRWRGGMMVLRWVAAGVLEAAKGFRRVKGCQDMSALVAALRARDARLGLGESSEDGCVVVNRAAAEFQQRTGHPPRYFQPILTLAPLWH